MGSLPSQEASFPKWFEPLELEHSFFLLGCPSTLDSAFCDVRLLMIIMGRETVSSLLRIECTQRAPHDLQIL